MRNPNLKSEFKKNSQELVRSGKGSKYEENEYKSSLSCLRQKLIGALDSTRIGRDFKQKKFQKIFFKNC